ncbi:MAG: hypothetical protein JNK15_12520 [Planctomycetes bacterium]|nr:hypothetical protein [Planctomycetota bacterium]
MTTILRAACAASMFVLPALAQDFLLYKFEGGCTNEVVNYAPQGAAIGNGVLETTSVSYYVPSLYGNALAGAQVSMSGHYTQVRTGWHPGANPVTGDFTLATYLKQRTAPVVPSHLFGCPTGLRMATGGSFGTGLVVQGLMANGTWAVLNADLQTPAQNAWVHLAVVVNANAGLVSWYIDGVLVEQDSGFVGGVDTGTSTGECFVGSGGQGAGSVYDLDEFLVSTRIYTPAEIAQLASGTRAGKGLYTSGTVTECGTGQLTFDSTGGRPYLGNASFALSSTTPAPAVHLLAIGFSRCSFGGGTGSLPLSIGVVLPMLNGCTLLADPELLLTGASLGGTATFPIAIPAGAPMGASLFAQALALDATTGAPAMSFGLALGVGY